MGLAIGNVVHAQLRTLPRCQGLGKGQRQAIRRPGQVADVRRQAVMANQPRGGRATGFQVGQKQLAFLVDMGNVAAIG